MAEARPTLSGRTGWAAPSVAPPELMHAFLEGLPVRLIATPRRDLQTCLDNERTADVVARNHDGYDHFPVVASTGVPGRIVGLIELVGWKPDNAPSEEVRGRMKPLGEDNLIGADASILSFVKSADTNPCRLVVSDSPSSPTRKPSSGRAQYSLTARRSSTKQ
jgi:hypothetical protein